MGTSCLTSAPVGAHSGTVNALGTEIFCEDHCQNQQQSTIVKRETTAVLNYQHRRDSTYKTIEADTENTAGPPALLAKNEPIAEQNEPDNQRSADHGTQEIDEPNTMNPNPTPYRALRAERRSRAAFLQRLTRGALRPDTAAYRALPEGLVPGARTIAHVGTMGSGKTTAMSKQVSDRFDHLYPPGSVSPWERRAMRKLLFLRPKADARYGDRDTTQTHDGAEIPCQSFASLAAIPRLISRQLTAAGVPAGATVVLAVDEPHLAPDAAKGITPLRQELARLPWEVELYVATINYGQWGNRMPMTAELDGSDDCTVTEHTGFCSHRACGCANPSVRCFRKKPIPDTAAGWCGGWDDYESLCTECYARRYERHPHLMADHKRAVAADPQLSDARKAEVIREIDISGGRAPAATTDISGFSVLALSALFGDQATDVLGQCTVDVARAESSTASDVAEAFLRFREETRALLAGEKGSVANWTHAALDLEVAIDTGCAASMVTTGRWARLRAALQRAIPDFQYEVLASGARYLVATGDTRCAVYRVQFSVPKLGLVAFNVIPGSASVPPLLGNDWAIPAKLDVLNS